MKIMIKTKLAVLLWTLAGIALAVPVTVEINTDLFGGETSWSLFADPDGANVFVDGSPGGTLVGNTLHLFPQDLAPNVLYEFTINDSFGDGICCSFGAGFYDITFNGNSVIGGPVFWGGATGTGTGGDGTNGFVGPVSDVIRFRIPEPGTMILLSLGLLGLGFAHRRRFQK